MRSLSRLFFLAAVCTVLLSGASWSAASREDSQWRGRTGAVLAAAGHSREVFNGRNFNLYTPSSAKEGAKVPLLVVLHGGLGNADFIENALEMNPVAEKYGLIVAYLNGTEGRRRVMQDKRTWNAGGCCGPAERENVDDVRYIEDFIRSMTEKYPVDTSRIYLMGHSNGAMMSYRFACERPGVVAAMVAVSGPLMVDHCSARGLKVLHIHGALDEHVPLAGGRGEKTMTQGSVFRSVADTQRIMTDSGASFTLHVIPGLGHQLKDIKTAVRREFSTSLPDMAAKFLLDK